MAQKIKKVAFVYRPYTGEAITCAEKVIEFLESRKVKVFLFPKQKPIKNTEMIQSPSEIKKLDLVIVFGGDGTFLRAAHYLDGEPIPILGINLGSLGFLTQVRKEDMEKTIEQALDGRLERRNRSLLEIKVVKNKTVNQKYLALNEIVIERGVRSQLMHLSIQRGKNLVSKMKGDGVLIASPTGSTAYNLAAGGPVLHPDLNGFVLTPISPHSLTTRPIIFSDDLPLCLSLAEENQKGRLVIDGQFIYEINVEYRIYVRRSKKSLIVLGRPGDGFFRLLREKLKFGQRA